MRILLDAKDLIDVIEHGKPIPAHGLDKYLRGRNAELVLSFTNVRELVAPLTESNDFLSMRDLLRPIEALPVCYIREAPIPIEELRAALKAFCGGREPQPIQPYVKRWDETFNYPGPSPAQMLVGFTLDEIIFRLWRRDPRTLQHSKSQIKKLRELFEADRSLPQSARLSLEDNFVSTVAKHLKQWSVSSPEKGVEAFARWIYSNPTRCPGLRLNYDTYHELLGNIGAIPKEGDIRDFAHINAVPYVDAVTFDRRITHYCSMVSKKLRKLNSAINYPDYIFSGLKQLVDALP